MSFNINDPAGIQALLNTLRASQAWSQVSHNNSDYSTTSEVTPAAGVGATTATTASLTQGSGPQAPIPAYELPNGNGSHRDDDTHGHGNEHDEPSMTPEYTSAVASNTAGGVPAIAQTTTHVSQQQNTTGAAPPRPRGSPPPPPLTTTTALQLPPISSAASSNATPSVSALLAQLQSPSSSLPWTLPSSIPSSSPSSRPTAEISVHDHLHHHRASAAGYPPPSSSSLPDTKGTSRGITSSASTRPNTQHNQHAAGSSFSALSTTATPSSPLITLPEAPTPVSSSTVDTASSTTPVRSGQDLRALTFQQALPILLSAIQDPAFVNAVRKLQDEQAQLETKLWREREMIREKFEEKVRVAQNKAKMIGTQITKHEAQTLTEAYRKALTKFDRERVLPAWDALMGKQQRALEALGVPTMFETRDRKDCERQKKVMQTLQGLVADDAT